MSLAADSARTEFEAWSEIVQLVEGIAGSVTRPGPTEREVTGFDPTTDLERRARRWGFDFPTASLADLARFAAGLARAEAEAWEASDGVVATQAYEDRRFLLGDRIASWTVPWADVAGRCHPEARDECHRIRDLVLDLGERLRVAPALSGGEGLAPPGEDSIGPFPPRIPGDLNLLGSGSVIFDATAVSLGAPDRDHLQDVPVDDVRALFENTAARWRSLAVDRPGTARLWLDLAARADHSASALR